MLLLRKIPGQRVSSVPFGLALLETNNVIFLSKDVYVCKVHYVYSKTHVKKLLIFITIKFNLIYFAIKLYKLFYDY